MALDQTRLSTALNPVLKQGFEDAIKAVFSIIPGPGDAILSDFCQAFADGVSLPLAEKIIAEIKDHAEVQPGTFAVDPMDLIAPNGGGPLTGDGSVDGTGSII